VNLTQVNRIGLDSVEHYAGQQTGAIGFQERVNARASASSPYPPP
jgi:hypothetical protein